MEKIKPLFDRVLLRPEPEQQSANGIFIPHESGERSRIMTVAAAGDTVHVKQGDRAAVAKYAGTEISIGTEKFLIVKECDILCLFY